MVFSLLKELGEKINYKNSGVDVQKAELLTSLIGFENMFAGLIEHPVLPEYYFSACTDGVGTKIIPLLERNDLNTIANDLVAMNLNDLITTGAKPVFFLDYIAVNKLDVDLITEFITELKNILNNYNCALLGGETSELNDMIKKGVFDVSGTIIGLVKKENILSKDNVKSSDVIIGLSSNGPHSNGFTLIRKMYEQKLITKEEFETSLKPTHIYADQILELADKKMLKAAANITGGGLYKNLDRIFPNNLSYSINTNNIPKQPLFEKFKNLLGKKESYSTFNMGVGMCLIVSKNNVNKVMSICAKYKPFVLGKVT